MMKKVLYYLSMVLMVLVTLMMGFSSGAQSLLMIVSSSVLAILLIVVLAIMDHQYVWYIPNYLLVIITHMVYLFAGASFTEYLIYILAFCFFLSGFSCYSAMRKGCGARYLIVMALLMKVCLVPEDILNYMIAAASGNWEFVLFSYLLLLLSSAYAWCAIWRCIKEPILKKPFAILGAVLNLFFALDILACVYVWIKIKTYRVLVPEPKTPIYESASFSRTSRKKKQNPNPAPEPKSKKKK